MYKCQYFSIKELVSPIVYDRWGEQAWMFFDEDVLNALDKGRESYGFPIIINNWAFGGNLTQCGLRCNLDQIVKDKTKINSLYLSAHTMGKAFDLHDKYGHNNRLWTHFYNLIKQNKTNFKRIENINQTPTWTHIDKLDNGHIIF